MLHCRGGLRGGQVGSVLGRRAPSTLLLTAALNSIGVPEATPGSLDAALKRLPARRPNWQRAGRAAAQGPALAQEVALVAAPVLPARDLAGSVPAAQPYSAVLLAESPDAVLNKILRALLQGSAC